MKLCSHLLILYFLVSFFYTMKGTNLIHKNNKKTKIVQKLYFNLNPNKNINYLNFIPNFWLWKSFNNMKDIYLLFFFHFFVHLSHLTSFLSKYLRTVVGYTVYICSISFLCLFLLVPKNLKQNWISYNMESIKKNIYNNKEKRGKSRLSQTLSLSFNFVVLCWFWDTKQRICVQQNNCQEHT